MRGGGLEASPAPSGVPCSEAPGRGGLGREGLGEGRTHLGTQRPGGQHVATVVELIRLHLGVAGPAERGDALELGRALEDLHVVDQGLVALGDDGFVLGGREGTEPEAAIARSPTATPPMGLCLPICKMGGLEKQFPGVLLGPRALKGEPPTLNRAEGTRTQASHFRIRRGQEGSCPRVSVALAGPGHRGFPEAKPEPRGTGQPLPCDFGHSHNLSGLHFLH